MQYATCPLHETRSECVCVRTCTNTLYMNICTFCSCLQICEVLLDKCWLAWVALWGFRSKFCLKFCASHVQRVFLHFVRKYHMYMLALIAPHEFIRQPYVNTSTFDIQVYFMWKYSTIWESLIWWCVTESHTSRELFHCCNIHTSMSGVS